MHALSNAGRLRVVRQAPHTFDEQLERITERGLHARDGEQALVSLEALVTYIRLVVGLGITFGKVFGGYQVDIARAIIDAIGVRSCHRRVVNLLTGILIASLFTIVGAVSIGAEWQIVPAGIMASVEASRVHDREATAVTTVANQLGDGRKTQA